MKHLIDSKYPFIRIKEMKSTYVYKAIHFLIYSQSAHSGPEMNKTQQRTREVQNKIEECQEGQEEDEVR